MLFVNAGNLVWNVALDYLTVSHDSPEEAHILQRSGTTALRHSLRRGAAHRRLSVIPEEARRPEEKE